MPSGYDCSGPRSPISVDNDITGSGVIANYVATAGFAVLLIIIYFLMVYDPALDPFRKTDQDPPNHLFRPNPIDKVILRTVRHIPKRLMGARKLRINVHYEKCFIECFIAMSDLQIVTGFSILISGYAQLHQGLSSFHWMVIVDLAWFSSLTHLACLTLLRNHLYNHSRQRMWRLLCMAVLVILLTVALSFTGGYDWTSREQPGGWEEQVALNLNMIDPAMCHLSSNSRSSMAYCAMIVSILLIVFGFVGRIIKLHKTISVDAWAKATIKLSTQACHLLNTAFAWCCLNSSSKSLKRTLIYRPLLTTLLVAQIFLDGWSSMFLEVCWLLAGFAWGAIRLFGVLATIQMTFDQDYLTNGTWGTYKLVQDSDGGHSDWEFGQVVALVLLLAPLITIIKHFNHDDKQTSGEFISGSDDTNSRSSSYSGPQSSHPTVSPFTHETSRWPDNPERTWDGHTQTLGAAMLYLVLMGSTFLTIISTTPATPNPLEYWKDFYLPVIIVLIGFWEVVLFSLTIELDLSHMPLWAQRLMHLANILFFVSSAMLSMFRKHSLAWIGHYWFLISAAVFYILCAVFCRILGSVCFSASGRFELHTAFAGLLE